MTRDTHATATPAPTPRRRRWRRRLLWTLATLVLVVGLAPLSLSLGPVRSWLAGKVGERLGREVQIGSAFAFWGRGIDLEDITVQSPQGFDGPLATVRRIHAELDVLGALRGKIQASVRVVEPHLTFRRHLDGTGNADGILERLRAGDRKESAAKSDSSLDVELVLVGGRIEAPEGESTPAGTLDQMQFVAALNAQGLTAEFSCRALGARSGGGDAGIALKVQHPKDREGSFTFEVEAIDLGRAASLVLAATGVSNLSGHVELKGAGAIQASGAPTGEVTLTLKDLRGTTRDGTALGLASLVASADAVENEGQVSGKVRVAGSDLRVVPTKPQGAVGFTEKDLLLRGNFAYEASEDKKSLVVSEGHFGLGEAASITMSKEIRVVLEPTVDAVGTVEARVDLSRLATLAEFIPALKSLQSGTLRADLQARPTDKDRLNIGVFARVENLVLAPGTLALYGYQEREAQVSAVVRESEADGMSIALHRLSSAGLSADETLWKQPLIVRWTGDRPHLEGPVKFRADLAALSPLLASALSLEPKEQLAGTVTLDGTATWEERRQVITTKILASQVLFPPSMAVRGPAQSLDGKARVEVDATEIRARLESLTGMGIQSAEASGRLEQSGEAWRLADANAKASLDLSSARSWLLPLMELDASTRLGGQVELSQLQIIQERAQAERRVVAKAEVREFFYQAKAGQQPIQEPIVTLTADGSLAERTGRHRFRTLRLLSQGLNVTADGASVVLEPDRDLDVTAAIQGQAARLAPWLSAALGEGYEDLRGEGAVDGKVMVRGGTGENLRHLIVDASLGLGTWTSAGMELKDVRLTALRPRLDDALDISLTSGLNGGQAQTDLSLTPSKQALPWKGRVRLDRVDASRIVVSKGAGNYLTYLLPAVLPADSKVPVLSGLLDADISLEAADLGGPAMADSLTGKGRIDMKEGEVRNSTLLGGTSMNQLVTVLRATVPEAASAIEGVGKALVFQTLESRFSVGQRAVRVEPLTLKGTYVNISMRGNVRFDEHIALEADLVLEGSAGEKVKELLPDRKIPLELTGTLSEPQTVPRLDLKALLASPLLKRLPGLEEIGKKKPKELLEDLFGRKK